MAKLVKIQAALKELDKLDAAYKTLTGAVVSNDAEFDLAADNLGHWFTHLTNLKGTLAVLRSQAKDWETREKAAEE